MRVWIPLVVVSVLGVGGYFGWRKWGPDGQLETLCRKEIVESLTSPSSAVISDVRRDGLFFNGARRIRLVVDSENAYSAMLRTYFVCNQSNGTTRFAVVDRSDWTAMDETLSRERAYGVCLSMVKQEFSQSQDLPTPVWTEMALSDKGELSTKVSLQSPAWGSAKLACRISADHRVSISSGT